MALPRSERGGREARPQSKAVLRYDFFVAVGTGDTWRTFDPRRGLEIDLPYTGKTVLLMVGEPRGYYPRMRILEDLLRKHLSSDAPSLFVAPDRTVQLLLQRFQQRKLPRSGRAKLVFPVKAKGRPSVDLWSHPFAVDQRYRWDKTFKKQKREQLAVVKLYEIARVMQLESQYFSAAEKYAFAINKIKHPGALRDCSFFRAVCLQEEGQLETALVAFQKHLADHQDSPWKTLIQIRMGECYAKLGQKADALAAWGRVAGPRAAASAKLSQSLEKWQAASRQSRRCKAGRLEPILSVCASPIRVVSREACGSNGSQRTRETAVCQPWYRSAR